MKNIDRNKLYILTIYIPSNQSMTKDTIVACGECSGKRIRNVKDHYDAYFDKIYFMTNGKETVIDKTFNHNFETTEDCKYWRNIIPGAIEKADKTAQIYLLENDFKPSISKLKKIIKQVFKI